MTKETYIHGKRDLYKKQKRPIYMAKETYIKKQKRPIYMAKETYIKSKRDLFI